MLLVQQAQHPVSVSLMPNHFAAHHRRNPSAPAVVVQSTKTPGLLSLSKPISPRPNANPASNRRPTPRQPKAKPVQPPVSQEAHAEKEGEKLRGRGAPAKDKTTRNSSKPSAGHGGRARQQSPSPFVHSEQASTDETLPVSILSKPVSPPTPAVSSNAKANGPTLLNAPSGRLARRRNRASIPFPPSVSAPELPKTGRRSQTPPARPRPVPVPVKAKPNTLPMSRSDPIMGHFPHGPVRRAVTEVFPICDDNDDGLERPSTPSPTSRNASATSWQNTLLFESDGDERGRGLRTAPIASQGKHFFPSPSPSPRAEHKRAPSVPADGIFNMSFDSDNELNVSDVTALFGRGLGRPLLDDPTRSLSTPNGKPGVTFKYASSMFQNSPSPEHLPPPRFSLASIKKELAGQH